jgi:hypothetical protein
MLSLSTGITLYIRRTENLLVFPLHCHLLLSCGDHSGWALFRFKPPPGSSMCLLTVDAARAPCTLFRMRRKILRTDGAGQEMPKW